MSLSADNAEKVRFTVRYPCSLAQMPLSSKINFLNKLVSCPLNRVQTFLPRAILIINESLIKVQIHFVIKLFINPF